MAFQRMLGKLFGGSGQTVYFAFYQSVRKCFCRNDLGSAAGKSAGYQWQYLDIGQAVPASPSRTKAVSYGVADGGHNGCGELPAPMRRGKIQQRIVTARMICPVISHVSAAAAEALLPLSRFTQRSARPTILCLPASADCNKADPLNGSRVLSGLLSLPSRRRQVDMTVPLLTPYRPQFCPRGGISPVSDSLIDGGLTGKNNAVHGTLSPGSTTDAVADPDLLGGDDFLCSVALHPLAVCGVRCTSFFNAGSSFGYGELLQ